MQFQLVIRNTIASEGDVFGIADVRLMNDKASVGTSRECDVVVADENIPDEIFFHIDFHSTDAKLTVPESCNVPVYINNEQAQSRNVSLLSGDEIRVGHWTFRFQKVRQRVGTTRHGNLLALATRILIIVIIGGEIMLALWLPGKLKYENMVATEIIQEQCIMLLDQLRRDVADKVSGQQASNEADRLKNAAVRIVAEELDRTADFVRTNQEMMQQEQWIRLRDDLDRLQGLCQRIDAGSVFKDMPDAEISEAIHYILTLPAEKL